MGQLRSIIKGVDSFELSVGPSYTSIYNDNLSSNTRRTKIGGSIELSGIYNLSNKFDLSVGLSLQRKGFKARDEVFYYDVGIDFNNCNCTLSSGIRKTNLNLDYAIISPLIRYSINRRLFVEGGAYGGKLVTAKVRYDNTWDNTQIIESAVDSFEAFDFGIASSVGYRMNLDSHLMLSAKFLNQFGLTRISSSAKSQGTHNNSFSILISLIVLKKAEQ